MKGSSHLVKGATVGAAAGFRRSLRQDSVHLHSCLIQSHGLAVY